MNKVEAFILSIPIIKAVMREELMITVFDHEKYIYYAPTKELNFNYKIGGPLPDMYLDYALVDKSGPVVLKVPAEEFGIPFDSINIPVKDDMGEMIGAINVAVSTKKTDELNEIVETVEAIANNLLSKVQNIAHHSQNLSVTTGQMAEKTASTVQYSEEIKHVAGTINMISEQTNLLGLNAAIEAARVGQEGAGFGVVANEIRKLSKSSKEATKSIEQTLKNISHSLQSMQESYEGIANSTQEETKLIGEFLSDLEKLQKTSDNIRTYLDEYVNVK